MGKMFANLKEAVEATTESHACRVLGPIVTEASGGKPGSRWAVVVIEEGVSKNRVQYSADVLSRGAHLYEGAKVFWNHSTATMRDPRDIAGFIKEAEAAKLPNGKTVVQGVLIATSPKLREQLIEAHEAENPELFGLSHTVHADTERVMLADGPAVRAKSIKAVESVDVVSFPSAGGRVMRLAAGSNSPIAETLEGLDMLAEKITKLKESRADLFAKLGAEPTEAQVDALLLEAITAPAAKTPDAPAAKGLSDADRSLLVEAKVDRLMSGRTIPAESKGAIRESLVELASLGADDAKLAKNLDAHVAAVAKLSEAKPTGSGQPTIEVTKDEAEKLIEALDGFFAGDEKAPKSFRKLYETITGDTGVTGRIQDAKGLRRFERMLEAINSTDFSNVLASSMNRQLVNEYRAKGGAYADWGKGWLCTVNPVFDFRNQERTRFGGYGNLSSVSEGAPYSDLTSPTDEKASYSVGKYGGIETISFEMVKNDDVGAVRRIPQKMAMAARRTLYEFVHNLYATNPTLDTDSVALFHSSHGSNLTTSALAASTFTTARLSMMKQSEKSSSKRLGLVLQHLMVPMDLEETAVNLFRRTTENDAKFIVNPAQPQIHVITHLTDATDWFACAGVDQCDQIEVGFLDGKEDPEIVVADNPQSGSLFSADRIQFKIRHIYGGDVLDFRGFYGGYGVS